MLQFFLNSVKFIFTYIWSSALGRSCQSQLVTKSPLHKKYFWVYIHIKFATYIGYSEWGKESFCIIVSWFPMHDPCPQNLILSALMITRTKNLWKQQYCLAFKITLHKGTHRCSNQKLHLLVLGFQY